MRKFAAYFVLWYLRFFAKIQLLKFRPTVVGVGGTSGKTSLSNFISIILSQKLKVRETKGKNSETGIPLNILNLSVPNYTHLEWLGALILAPLRILFDWSKFDVLVSEMGIDGPSEPKNMSYLLRIVRPKIGVLTNISYEHSVYFEEKTSDKEKILTLTANEESLLLRSLPSDGLAVFNLDDPNIAKLKEIKAKKLTVSLKNKSADFFIEKIDVNLTKFIIHFLYDNKKFKMKISQPLPDHYAYSLVMALAVCTNFGLEIDESIKILEEKFSIPFGRLSIFKGKNEMTIVDSSYNNATLQPIIDILDFLDKISQRRRKVAILGDMRELGIISKMYHEEVAKKLLKTTDLVILVGPLSFRFIAPVLKKNNHKFYSFNTFTEAKESIKRELKKNDVVLVKSSQNTLFLERAVEMLLKNSSDKQKLARRGKFWDRIRSQTL